VNVLPDRSLVIIYLLAVSLSAGAGVFLTTIVVGAVSLFGSFHLMERPFLRDLIFYIITVFFTFYICYNHKITLVESFSMSAFYCDNSIHILIWPYFNGKQQGPGAVQY